MNASQVQLFLRLVPPSPGIVSLRISIQEVAEVRRAGAKDVPALAEMLARAFRNDAVANYLFPEAIKRERSLVPFFSLQLSHVYLPRGEVYTTRERNTAALWIGPDPVAVKLWDVLAHLVSLPMLGTRLPAIRRMTRFLMRCHPSAPHYYLGTLGTEPAAQRQGLASEVLRPVLKQCDARGLLAYLECSTPEARALYERHGFSVSEQVRVPVAGPTLWLMQRVPKVASKIA